MKRLTKEQQDLVTKNHNLIYDFAKKKNLLISEYYDILAMGLCKAAMEYKENNGMFSTFAYPCMENELINHYVKTNRKHCIPEEMIISSDAPRNGEDFDNKVSLLDSLKDDSCTDDIVLGEVMSTYLISLLSEKEQTVVNLIMDGMTHREIAQKMKCKRQNISYYIQQIRKKWANYCS